MTRWILVVIFVMQSFFVNAEDKPFVFAVNPWKEPVLLNKLYKPMMSYLEQEMKRKLTFIVVKDYAELQDKMRQGKIDVGYFSAANYVKTKVAYPELKYLLTAKEKGDDGQIRDHYKGVIITNKSSGIKALEDLKGKRFAFTDPDSSSGYLYPRALLKKRNIEPSTYFSSVVMLKKHEKVAEHIGKNAIDGGATWDGAVIIATRQYGDVFHILAETDPIPMDVVAAAGHVAEDVSKSLQSALIKLNLEHPVIKEMQLIETTGSDAGFSIRDDTFYNVVREAAILAK